MSQGLQALPEAGKAKKWVPPLEPREGNSSDNCGPMRLIWGLLASRAVREKTCAILSHKACGHLSQQPQETNEKSRAQVGFQLPRGSP